MVIDYKKKYLNYKKKYLDLIEKDNNLNILDSTKKKINLKMYNINTKKEDLVWKDNMIIVGNAISDENKNKINDFNMVIRVNKRNFKHNEKTDLFVWALSSNILENLKDLIIANKNKQHLVYNNDVAKKLLNYTNNVYIVDNVNNKACSNKNNCDKFFEKNNIIVNDSIKIKDLSRNGKLRDSWFTTGLRTILWALINEFKDITITGFTLDANDTIFKDKVYYRNSSYSTTKNKDLEPTGCCHDLFDEYYILQQLIDKKLIKVLK